MGMEIERKFLVHREFLPELREGVRIIQGYLSENPSVRFRIIDSRMNITVKEYYAQGERFELETPFQEITGEEQEKLRQLAICPPIRKVRHRIKAKGLVWEVDVYEGENLGLITVDVELPAVGYPLSFPAWVDEQHDISADQRYTNLSLGRRPFSRWSAI